MKLVRIIQFVKPWLAPKLPGRGKHPVLALCVGFLLGPLGILVYLRSIADALLLLTIQTAMIMLLEPSPIILALLGGCYALSRVLHDSHGNPPTPTPTPTPTRATRATDAAPAHPAMAHLAPDHGALA